MTAPIISAAMMFAELVPSLAKWLGGDEAESVATQVLKTAQRITGVESPEMAAKMLRENAFLFADFQRFIAQIEADLELQRLKDRQDARARDVAIHQTGQRNIRADVMVVSAALGLILCLGSLAMFSGELPGEAVGIISTIAGIFGSCLKDAYAFEFGSSRGSKEKDMAMVKMLEK